MFLQNLLTTIPAMFSKAKPPTLSLYLEIAEDAFGNKKELILDLWRGFSASIGIVVICHDPPAVHNQNPEDCAWQYFLPLFESSENYDNWFDDGSWDIHFARALNLGLLAIKDSQGDSVYIDITANPELSKYIDQHVHGLRADRTLHYMSIPSPGLLQQL